MKKYLQKEQHIEITTELKKERKNELHK